MYKVGSMDKENFDGGFVVQDYALDGASPFDGSVAEGQVGPAGGLSQKDEISSEVKALEAGIQALAAATKVSAMAVGSSIAVLKKIKLPQKAQPALEGFVKVLEALHKSNALQAASEVLAANSRNIAEAIAKGMDVMASLPDVAIALTQLMESKPTEEATSAVVSAVAESKPLVMAGGAMYTYMAGRYNGGVGVPPVNIAGLVESSYTAPEANLSGVGSAPALSSPPIF